MTDKNWDRFWQRVKLLAIFLLGLGIGGLVVSTRYDSEIRTDQLELEVRVAKIEGKKAMIDGLIQKLIFEIKQVQADRKSLEELKIKLSKGEG